MANMANDTDMVPPETGSRSMRRGGSTNLESPAPPRFGRFALGVAVAGALASGVLGTLAYGTWFNEDQQTYAQAIAAARKTLGVPGSAPLSLAATGAPMPPVEQLPTQASTRAPAQPDMRQVTTPRVQRVAPRGQPVDANAIASVSPDRAYATDGADMPSTVQTAQVQSDADSRALNGPLNDAPGGAPDRLPGEWSGRVAHAPARANADTASTTAATDPTTTATNDPAMTLSSNTPAAGTSRAAANARHGTGHTANGASAARRAREARLAQQRNGNGPGSNARREGGLFARVGEFFRRVSYRQHQSGHQQQDLYSHP